MTRRRLLLVNAVLVVLIGGHLYDIAVDKEHWPFSQYQLFARLQDEEALKMMQLFGVPRESDKEFYLGEVSGRFSSKSARLMESLRYIGLSKRYEPEEREKILEDKLREQMALYEEMRLSGQHQGPPLQNMKLYYAQWYIESQPQFNDPPDDKRLIAEVSEP